MYFIHLVGLLCIFQFAFQTFSYVTGGVPKNIIRQETGRPLQDLVTWDQYSLSIRGERLVLYSGEFHPFRLPVTDLWLDVFQKVKALGYNGVSFYIDWALLEGTEGTIRADGIFALEPFFDAASEAGIYLLARPGPYINAEVSGGGFPGWLGRINGTLRINATDFLSATDLYIQTVAEKVVKAQITNGGPVILYQVENEYTYPAGDIIFPNLDYFDYVINQAIDGEIIVPIINNDAGPRGLFAPGNSSFGNVTVDIYGHDSYPLGFDCSNPYVWPTGNLPTNFRQLHEQQSPSTPYSIIEFQGGSFDPWGGPGFGQCNKLINSQFERVFYKNNWAFGITIYNQYMIFGGTNWGNLGHPGGYTSYDYAAVIAEDRNVAREKYSEAKLQANFLKVSSAYATSVPSQGAVNGSFADTEAIATTMLMDVNSPARFYIVRHAAYNSNDSTSYKFNMSTSIGAIEIPQLSNFSSTLTLDGRDSKVHVSDYMMNDINLIYSSAEVFTWKTYDNNTILIVYGGENETHELAVPTSVGEPQSNGSRIATQSINNTIVIQWQVTPSQQSITIGPLKIYLLWRNSAYNWWDIELPSPSPISNFSSPSKQSVIASGPYLLRTAQLTNGDLYLTGEINATTTLEIIASPPYTNLYFNNIQLNASPAVIEYVSPQITLPDLSTLTWHALDTLPELSPSYSDTLWPDANHTSTNNPLQPTTPTVLYASDYGFHTGPLLYRGHFTSPSASTSPNLTLTLTTQGGYAYAYQIYLNSTRLYSYPGISTFQNHSTSLQLVNLSPSTQYTLTIIIDHTGLNENFNPGFDSMKAPRGILNYTLTSSSSASASAGREEIPVTWKLTGNLHGEHYIDLSRGPLNEGGLFFERNGFHLPGAPISSSQWGTVTGGPVTSSSSPSFNMSATSGIIFYATSFNLSLPSLSYDIPLQFVFSNTSTTSTSSSSTSSTNIPAAIRANLYINGFQFGKYINNIGPQTAFPVPEGILNYQGENYVGVYVWDLSDGDGERVGLGGLRIEQSSTATYFGVGGRRVPRLTVADSWTRREGTY